jgi:general secretion pathway protein D
MKTLNRFLMAGFLALASPSSAAEGTVRLQAGEMRLQAFLEMVSERLDLQVDASELGSPLPGTVTVADAGPLSPERAKALVLSTLYLEGYTWIHDPVLDLYRIMRARDARDSEIPIIFEAGKLPDSDLLVTYVLPLRHAPPEHVARNLRSFMPAASRIIPEGLTRTVLITDSANNISKLRKLVERLDTPESARQAEEALKRHSAEPEEACPPPAGVFPGPKPGVIIALFSLIALVIGFLARGYVIRRIEGGL